MLAGLIWARDSGAALLATVPCDTPRLPADLVERLAAAVDDAHPAAVARAPDGLHPLCGVWRASLADPLAALLAGGHHPPVRAALEQLGGRTVDFPDASAFANVNTPGDLTRLSQGSAPTPR